MIRNLFLAALAVAGLASCGPSGPNRPPCPAGKVCLHYGNTSDPATLDPHLSTGTWEDRIQSDMLIGLSQSGPDGKPIPGMAERWEISPDGLTWTFHLRQALWSDGVPVTADDFVFSFRRLLDPKTGSEYASVFYLVKGAQAVNEGTAPLETLGVTALDARTLRVELNHPAPYLIELAKHHTMYPLPKHVVERWGRDWIKPEHFVGNGPYVLVASRLGDYVKVVKNPRFYEAETVCIDEVYYYPTTDAISAERRVFRGELDINTDIQSNRIAYLRERKPEYVRTNVWLGVAYVAFNTNSKAGFPAFRDRRVRQALAMSIDREFIAGKLLRGGQLPANTFVPPGVANYAGAEPPFWAAWPLAKRQAQARRLLAEAGFGPGRPLKFEIKHRNTPDPMLFMSAIQADWKEIGVQVTLAQQEGQIAYADYRARAFQVADAAWIADYNDPTSFLDLQRSFYGPQNYGDYNNPEYDRLMALADQEPDAARRAAYIAKAEHMMLEDAPVAPVYFYVNKNLVSPGITGWVDNLLDHHRTRWLCTKPH
ncbi:peptide ABC transporter substrate-binding protein [Phenylobacterium sp.]|uniref:peptide ABC transporter substrate-binding protein n=1 Tax=Phenylobacterium sp. TaxID=1871053 RepID=UPI00273175A9|nr:peptide ABC transporter substrate-binding protein [Phenylobacterium sp.]MDP1875150.1 peptide ABC transporter substrate-binding protein [Phenylobacterium sp.]